jgi:hypothetical protein
MDVDVNSLDQNALRTGAGALFGGSGSQQRIAFERGAALDVERSALGGVWEVGHANQGSYKEPVYKDVVMVVIIDPEPPHDRVMREATGEDFAKYPKQWARDQRFIDLTPIAHLPTMTPAKREMCSARNLYWVEQMSEKKEDDLCDELKPLPMIARQYMMIASGQKPRVKLAAA